MRRSKTPAERVLMVYRAVVAALWGCLVLGVALTYRGGNTRATWTARVIMLAVAVLVTAVAVFVAHNSWNRAVSHPLPVRGANAWAARQPGWRLAAICWAPLAALTVGLGLGLRLPWLFMPIMLTASGITVTGSVAQSKVIWQRQQERSHASSPAEFKGSV